MFTATFIRMRMAALAAEIDRLDTDPDVFARAFRMNVARSAYEALRTDHRRLGEPAASGHQAELLDATVGAAPARASRVEELVL